MQSLEHLNFDVSNPKHLENPFYKKNTDIFMHTIIQNAFLLYILFCLYVKLQETIILCGNCLQKNSFFNLSSLSLDSPFDAFTIVELFKLFFSIFVLKQMDSGERIDS